MIPSIPLSVLLRILQQRDPSLIAHGPTPPVNPLAPVQAIAGGEAAPRTPADPHAPSRGPRDNPHAAAGDARSRSAARQQGPQARAAQQSAATRAPAASPSGPASVVRLTMPGGVRAGDTVTGTLAQLRAAVDSRAPARSGRLETGTAAGAASLATSATATSANARLAQSLAALEAGSPGATAEAPERAAAPTAAAATAAAATATSAATASVPPAAALALSRVGALLAELLAPMGTTDPPGLPQGTAGERAAPLLAKGPVAFPGTPGVPVRTLAQALAHAVTTSGVFYESHLAQWAADRYPLAQLAAEPQAGWAQQATGGDDTAQGGAPSALPDRTDAGPAIDARREVLPALVRQQIDALELRQFGWQGEIWPGQRVSIAIAEERADNLHRDTAPAAAWRTQFELSLPELGAVTVALRLDGKRLDIGIAAASPAADARLKAGSQDLVAALAARSVAVTGVSFRHA